MIDRKRIFELLPEFIEKWTYGEKLPFSIQKFSKKHAPDDKDGLNYYLQKYKTGTPRSMTVEDWFNHFSQESRETTYYIEGSYAMIGIFPGDHIKWICFDADSLEEHDLMMNKIIPWLEQHGIEYILEHSRDHRRHLWVFTELMHERVALRLVMQMKKDIGQLTDEVYPFNEKGISSRRNAPIRIIGGWHYWLKGTAHIEYNGQEFETSPDIMQAVIDCKPVSVNKIESFCDLLPVKKVNKRVYNKQFKYIPRTDLPEPIEGLAPCAKTIATQCQAHHALLTGIQDPNEMLIQHPGIKFHDIGTCTSAMLVFSDIEHQHRDGRHIFHGSSQRPGLVEKFRDRSAESHHWIGDKAYEKFQNDATPLSWSCTTMDEKFDLCQGCPFKGITGFTNPLQLYYQSKIQQVKVKNVEVVSIQAIRDNTFPEIKDHVLQLAEEGKKETILIASPQGSGKSYFCSRDLVPELVRQGKSILFAVPTMSLEIEHEGWMRQGGVHELVKMASHKSIFKENNPYRLMFDECPNYDQIQYYTDLGVSSSYSKDKFCKNCIFANECPYPTQYSKATDVSNKVVIMTHAHLQAAASMRQLLQRNFDVLIIDETFVDNLVSSVRPEELEWEILQSSGFDWAVNLGDWMQVGGYASGKIYPKPAELDVIRQEFEMKDMVFSRLREFIDHYNSGGLMTKITGIKKFNPIPNIPITIMTDATPPLKKLQYILNEENIKVFGANQVLDVRDYHPKNRVISIVDSSASKYWLGKDENFYEVLNWVGFKCVTEHANERVVITTYLSKIGEIENPVKETINYLREKYPGIDIGDENSDARIIVAGMKVGVNTFAHFTVQFLLASVHLSPNDILKDTYHLKMAINYHRRRAGDREITNIYPEDAFLGRTCNITNMFVPIRKTYNGSVYEFPDYTTPVPADEEGFNILSYQQAIGRSQQAWRLRYYPDMPYPKTFYDLSNQWKQGLQSTEIRTFGQCIAELG